MFLSARVNVNRLETSPRNLLQLGGDAGPKAVWAAAIVLPDVEEQLVARVVEGPLVHPGGTLRPEDHALFPLSRLAKERSEPRPDRIGVREVGELVEVHDHRLPFPEG